MAHVLVVEDDEATRLLFETVLRLQKLKCTAVGDGAIAIELLQYLRYDAILLDLVLPKKSGFDVLCEIERTTPEMLPRVVVCTALSAPELRDRDELRKVGWVLLKPTDIGAIAGAVLRAVEMSISPARARSRVSEFRSTRTTSPRHRNDR